MSIWQSPEQPLEFLVTAGMVDRFARLTGDFSSLHMDESFGRRSGYRENVVHGLLPVMFVSALPAIAGEVWPEAAVCRSLSARFLKPVFVGERLVLEVKFLSSAENKDQTDIEFGLKHAESQAAVTTGFCTLADQPSSASPALASEPPPSTAAGRGMLTQALAEQNFQFADLHKGDQQRFRFNLLPEHAHDLYQLLSEGWLRPDRPDFSTWLAQANVTSFLATGLFSTFVGMCIPGKLATFMDFQASFEQPLKWGIDYGFTGQVRFASASTHTVAEKVIIQETSSETETVVTGKINAKVNDPPTQMPSIDYLQKNALDLQLKDKVVLVTGASRGIGETTAKLFSLYGARVVINYFRGEADAQRIVTEIENNGGQALAVQADVSDRAQVNRMVKRAQTEFGGIDVLVNNAVSNFYPTNFLELSWDAVQQDIDVVVKGAFNCCQAVLPLMIKNGGGKIINIGTVATETPPIGQAKYVIAKSGLVGLTRSLAVEFAAHNVQVNMVAPSMVDTDLTQHVAKLFKEELKAGTPMQRNATPVDVARTVLFLASALASFTTGQKIMVTGGNAPFL